MAYCATCDGEFFTGKVTEYRAEKGDTFGVFVFAEYAHDTGLVRGLAELDKQGYIITDTAQKTNVDGLYAAGDVCIKPLRQVVTAIGHDALVATELEKYAAEMQRKTGQHPVAPVPKNYERPASTPLTEAPTSSGNLFPPGNESKAGHSLRENGPALVLKLYLDNRPISKELEEYMAALAGLSNILTVEVVERQAHLRLHPV